MEQVTLISARFSRVAFGYELNRELGAMRLTLQYDLRSSAWHLVFCFAARNDKT